jgi:hypothetical protein
MSGLQTFFNVPVMPVKRTDRHVPRGGPIWPDFDQQTTARHCRGFGQAVDVKPKAQPCTEEVNERAVWGGYIDMQFGHLVCEHLTRVLPSLHACPDALFLFILDPGRTPADVPRHVNDIFEWFGLAPAQIRYITQPTLVRQLSVLPQGEILGKIPPSPAYLDMLDQLPARYGLRPRPADLVYVARLGLLAKGAGGHLGEAYLAQVLQGLGVMVVDPATLSIRDQLECYAGARTLVFAEGSAVHGRQLLGRVAQDIYVLRRRDHYNLGSGVLAPRVRRIQQVAACGRRLRVLAPSLEALPHLDAVFYDTAKLFACFDALGLDVRSCWSQKSYLNAAFDDAEQWVTAHAQTRIPADKNTDVMIAGLDAIAENIIASPRTSAGQAMPSLPQ